MPNNLPSAIRDNQERGNGGNFLKEKIQENSPEFIYGKNRTFLL